MIGIYIRVSSATQVKEGYSLQAQKERLTAFCTAQGWEHFKFYVEEGISAKNTKRPVYQKLMQQVKDKKINTVLVYKLDRIMRSIGELDIMLKTFDKHNCAFKSATEPFDTSNATGKLFIYLVGALAQWEIELSSERISMVLEEKVANEGVWIGNVPYPFDKDDNTKKLIPNAERSKVTLKMIELLRKGYSSVRIADYLNENNNDKQEWHHNSVLRILRNPAICGHTTWLDKTYKNTHEGIISVDQFNLIQEILDERKLAPARKIKSICIFQGKVGCPVCDHPMTVNRFYRTRKDGSEKSGSIYKCNKCSRQKKFNKSPSEPAILSAMYKYMENLKFSNINNIEVKNEKPDFIKQLHSIERKRSKFQKAWANDLMTDDEFQRRMEETREVYDDLKTKSENYKPPKTIDPEAIKNIVFTFNDNFKKLTLSEKREFVSMFIKKIQINVIPQKPKEPTKSKAGRHKIEVKNVTFY